MRPNPGLTGEVSRPIFKGRWWASLPSLRRRAPVQASDICPASDLDRCRPAFAGQALRRDDIREREAPFFQRQADEGRHSDNRKQPLLHRHSRAGGDPCRHLARLDPGLRRDDAVEKASLAINVILGFMPRIHRAAVHMEKWILGTSPRMTFMSSGSGCKRPPAAWLAPVRET